MLTTKSLLAFASLLVFLPVGTSVAAEQTQKPTSEPRSFAFTDTADLIPRGAKTEVVEYKGRKALHIITQSKTGSGFTLLKDVEFRDGTIEADVAAKITTPPGVRMPGFIGIAFRARPDASRYELFYLRPGNSKAEDQAMRNHSVQYSSEPDFGWPVLRTQWPAIYEAYTDMQPGEWTRVKIEVHGRRAKLYINGSPNPSLIVDGLKGEDLRGGIGLYSFMGEEAYFSNLKITSAAPEPIKNGGEAAGMWDVAFNTDAGPMKGTMNLTRDNNKLSGTWSGDLGDNLPVSGTWRDGYVELVFTGTWRDSAAPAPTRLAGWIDDDSGHGRMKVDGQAEGQWTAQRHK
ncbi:family 16 glycoside hydrolase [Edaphobacter albus]|uniref:family 16 glycoside hydrolase n=1 Tax=Edaphobacter sp. 4G125 TaxID=2763071 RepID=UPI0016467F8F|nr:family 16 glycoside hydrolase [Edaphobacter sp. 4G125]QNI36947.1 DUF1080 domain-containing protein [Edaphobacter sp. 4G125]